MKSFDLTQYKVVTGDDVDAALVDAVVRSVQPLVRSKNVELVCELEHDLGCFEVDSGMLRSAFINLLENAAEACAAEGSAKT